MRAPFNDANYLRNVAMQTKLPVNKTSIDELISIARTGLVIVGCAAYRPWNPQSDVVRCVDVGNGQKRHARPEESSIKRSALQFLKVLS